MNRPRDGFAWEPHDGEYRHRLVQTFHREGAPVWAFVVFMLNPGGNDLARFRRSVTCFRVRTWGSENGYDGASYLNLFSRVTTNSSLLAALPTEGLNDDRSNAAIAAEVARWPSEPIIAGWGNPPPRFPRSVYDERIDEVVALTEGRLRCLGSTKLGYPKHGRFWEPTDQLMPLPESQFGRRFTPKT